MPSYPPPVNAVTPVCTICGQAVFCGGPQCPSSSLPLPPDGVPMVSEAYSQVTALNPITGQGIPQVG